MPRSKSTDNKTQPTAKNVLEYLESVSNAGRREDAYELLDMMQNITGEPAVLWGPSIVGFGQYHYVYDSGREGDSMLTGFAPRKANMVVYVMPGFDAYAELLTQLGPCKTGSSCLYLGRLNKINVSVLQQIVAQSVELMRKKYGDT